MLDLGIDVGGTFIKYAIVDEENNIIRRWKKETIKFDTPKEFYDYLCADVPVENIRYIGLSVPGVLAPDSTILSEAAVNVRVMYHTNVKQEIESRLGRPAHVLNDAKSAGFCEMQLGSGKGAASSVYFVIGTGIGGCVCDDHQVIEGVNRVAGEFSNLACGFHEDGSIKHLWEIASMNALIDIYNEIAEEDRKERYGTEITKRYHAGEAAALRAMDQWCRNICLGFETIITFYNPELICVGGGISKEDWFIEKLRDTMQQENLKRAFPELVTTRIERCLYDNDANILGALLFARQKESEA
ncbi:MAG TPA: ROK family protein [Erysipelotrichaceae bacterium]|nr:ROK family protein [Erysipelotrichaceae bacterium]